MLGRRRRRTLTLAVASPIRRIPLSAVELRNCLTAVTATLKPATAIFDHPTLTELAQYSITPNRLGRQKRAASGNSGEELMRLPIFFKFAMRVGMPYGFGKRYGRPGVEYARARESPVRNNVSENVALLADGIFRWL